MTPYLTITRYRPLLTGIAASLLLFFLYPQQCRAGDGDGDGDPVPPFDELYISMTVQGVGSIEIPASISNTTVYLSVTDVFDYLKIKNTASPKLDSISGFFINQQSPYLIDKKNNRIQYKGKTYALKGDAMIRTETNLYLRADYFGQIFGLSCQFSFRSLSVVISTQIELPIIREMRQEMMRNNLRHLKGEMTADTTIHRRFPLYRWGMADWAVVNTQNAPGPGDTRLYGALGGVLAGGETTVAINYDNTIPFREREQFYQWRMVDNDNPALRQWAAGKLFTEATSTLYYPVVGLQFTNAPTSYRRAFGTYTYSNYTQPEWTVELYVNNELVDYTKADASGFFTFKVPLVYGNSAIKFRYYGPWGEERSSGQTIQIPYTFLPAHEFEYTTTAGMEEDSLHSKFARANANYGLNGRLTIGGGVEYLSSVSTSPVMPFVNASYRLSSHLLVAGEYTHDVRSKFIANYQSFSDLQVELDYIRYKEGQKAINNTYLEERKAIISLPIRKRHFSAFSRFTFYQIVLPGAKYTTLEELISGSIFGVSTNFTTYGLITEPVSPYVYSDLALSFRLPGKLIFNPETQFEYGRNRFFDIRSELGKYISSRGYLDVFYEKNYKIQYQSIGIGLRYDLPFAQTGSSFRRSSGINTGVISASGSLAYDDLSKHAEFSNRSSVGRGGIVISPYLDLNNNGKWDMGEPRVHGLKIQINNGRTEYSKDGTSIRISELESYTSYIVRLLPNFENISWHIKNMTLNIEVDPDQFKDIEIPVTVMGEVSGTVSLKEDDQQKPKGGIIIEFFREDHTLAAHAVTEADGSFDYTGLPPGSYNARIPAYQLDKLHLKAQPAYIPFTITASKEGDMITDLKFTLQHL